MNLVRPALWLTLLFAVCAIDTPKIDGQSFEYQFSQDRSQVLFQSSRNRQDIKLVDVTRKQSRPAFDYEKLAVELSNALQEKIAPDSIRFPVIDFGESPGELVVRFRGQNWIVTSEQKIRKVGPNQSALSRTLFLPPRRSPRNTPQTNLTIRNQLEKPVEILWVDFSGRLQTYGKIEPGQEINQHTYVGHVWLLKSEGKELGCFRTRDRDQVIVDQQLIESVQRQSRRKQVSSPKFFNRNRTSRSPDQKSKLLVKDHQLWLQQGSEETALTEDGSEKYTFIRSWQSRLDPNGGEVSSVAANGIPRVCWSPTSKHVLVFQAKVVPTPEVRYIESSPREQLQPKLRSYRYPKPGDPLSFDRYRLFSVDTKTEIPISHDLFHDPFRIRFDGWNQAGTAFRIRYNQRGHQAFRVLEISTDGTVRTIIEETSETFIQYSDPGKMFFRDLPKNQILWASERSGWNHLYRYDSQTGGVINAVTKGEWNVKRIVDVDQDQQTIWFYAVGVYPDQDPYHEHFCRVQFDGTNFRILTDGDGTHQVELDPNREYFLDTYSRVDLAPVTEFRSCITGDRIAEISRETPAQSQFGGRRLTERFVAKGRDGKTDIWGIIHWPRDFDPDKKYPVVENIYAGPHDHHVPKKFRRRFGHQYQVADAGMIVVQIDGMGTAWRSKTFHDVCHKNLRDAGFPDRIAWIKAAAKKFPQMDISRVGIYGGSAGGQNAMAALLWHHDFYKVAVADCGCHDNRMDKIWWNEQWMGYPIDESYAANSNMENAHLLQGKLMLVVGEKDQNVDPASTTQVVGKLIQHNKDFEFVLVVGAGHGAAETPWASRKRLNFLKQHLLSEQGTN